LEIPRELYDVKHPKNTVFNMNPWDFEKWTYQKCPFLLFPITFD
jgi:hypothetical protein